MQRIATVSIDFTNGFTLQRVTVTDPDVAPGSDILCSITKRSQTALADVSYVYVPNIVSQIAGSFDVLVAAISPDPLLPSAEMPNEFITLVYLIR